MIFGIIEHVILPFWKCHIQNEEGEKVTIL